MTDVMTGMNTQEGGMKIIVKNDNEWQSWWRQYVPTKIATTTNMMICTTTNDNDSNDASNHSEDSHDDIDNDDNLNDNNGNDHDKDLWWWRLKALW